MRDVDLELIEFDFDLTMAIVVMAADGTVYHRYGSRDPHDALSWMSIPSLVRLLHDTVEDHRAHEAAAEPAPREPAPRRVIDLPFLQRRLAAGQRLDCVHCHTVHDALHAQAVAQGAWRDNDKWVYPDPRRIGLTLDAGDQARVVAVAAGSPSAAAGLRAGDRLLRLGQQPRVRTVADVSWALHQEPAGVAAVPVTFVRDGAEHAVTMDLADAWKVCPPEEYAWRPYKWNLSPAPGFGGPALDADAKRRLGLPAATFAFRVDYLVDWGERADRGRAAAKAGIRKGDVVLSFAGEDAFASVEHFHAFVRLRCRVGQEVEVVLLRAGERHTLRYVLPE